MLGYPRINAMNSCGVNHAFIFKKGKTMHLFMILFVVLLMPITALCHDNEPSGSTTTSTELPGESCRANLVYTMIPSSYTGTSYSEWIEYQLPDSYDPSGPGHPLVVCWHSHQASCQSVAKKSTIDESCNNRGWIYLSVTGASTVQLSSLLAQKHCEIAIRYLDEYLEFNIDTQRIYMAGLSGGGLASASYACRHLSEEDYRIAGLIMVATVHDLTDLYNKDPNSRYWLKNIFGGTPAEFPFSYKQISSLYIENGTYAIDESMGRNLAHNLPVFVTYAENDPLPLIPEQNEILVDMLDDLNGNLIVDYHAYAAIPHSWKILDVETALDFVGAYTLDDQQTGNLSLLADRSDEFLWMTVVQSICDSFSEFIGHVDSTENLLKIEEATNASRVDVNIEMTALEQKGDMNLEYHSASPEVQVLGLSSVTTKPTYIVDDLGTLFLDWSYETEYLEITREASQDLDLAVSFEPYNLSLCLEPQNVMIGESYSLVLQNGDPHDSCLLVFSLEQTRVQVKPGRHLLVPPVPNSLLVAMPLDAGGALKLRIPVPGNTGLVGVNVFHQGLTYTMHDLKEISNLATLRIVR